MSVLIFSFNAVAPMLFLTALGWFILKRGHLDERSRDVINRICFRYLLAFMAFHNTLSINFYEDFNARILIFCALSILAILIVAWVTFTNIIKIEDPGRRSTFIVASYRSNNVIYAMTLAVSMFGQEGIRAAAVLIPLTIIVFNFFSVIVMVHHSQNDESDHSIAAEFRRTAVDTIKNPLIVSSALGVILSLLRVELPEFLLSGIASVALTATPMALIVLGSHLDLKLISGSLKPLMAVCTMRLVIIPAIMVPIAVLIGFRGPELGALMVIFAAPCAVTNLVMARNYKLDANFAAQTVILSTIVSMPTMFIIISILRAMALI